MPDEFLSEYMRHLGYNSNSRGGVCFGVIQMATQAMLTQHMDAFDKRITEMKQDMDNDYRLNDKERMEKGIYPFLDGVELYFQAHQYPDLFEDEKRPTSQNAKLTAPLVNSIEMEQQEGLHTGAEFTGVYSKEELIDYFTFLKESITESMPPDQPLALAFGDTNHAVTVGYDPITKKWVFVDPDHLPTKYIESNEEIAKTVMKAFKVKEQENIVLSTKVYSKNMNKEITDQMIDNWKNKEPLKKMHELTSLKANYITPKSKASLLSLSVRNRQYEMIKTLVEKGADPNQVVKWGRTILSYAIESGRSEAALQLLDHGADPNKLNVQPEKSPLKPSPETPLERAVDKGWSDVCFRLIEKGANVNTYMHEPIIVTAIKKELNDVCLELIAKGADVDVKDLSGFNSALDLAIEKSLSEVCLKILEKDVEIEDIDDTLSLALAGGLGDVCVALIQKGAKIESANIDALKSLHNKDLDAAIEKFEQKDSRRTPLLHSSKSSNKIGGQNNTEVTDAKSVHPDNIKENVGPKIK